MARYSGQRTSRSTSGSWMPMRRGLTRPRVWHDGPVARPPARPEPAARAGVPAALPGPAGLVLRLDDHVCRAAVPDVRPDGVDTGGRRAGGVRVRPDRE